MSGKILVAVDMSKMSEEVFSYGCCLAMHLKVEAAFIHVLPHPTFLRGCRAVPEHAEVAEIAKRNCLLL